VHGLRQTYHRLRNRFGCTRWYSKVTRLKWKLILVRLEIVLIMTHNRWTICAEHTMESEIFLTHTMELLGDVGNVESRFGPFRDSVSVCGR
jgi:hypothetical protein